MFHFPTDTAPQNLYQLNLSFQKEKMLKKTIDRTKFNMSIRYHSHDPLMVVKAIIESFRFEDEDEDEDEALFSPQRNLQTFSSSTRPGR